MPTTVLVIGSEGQIGSELCEALIAKNIEVIRADIKLETSPEKLQYHLEASDKDALRYILEKHKVETVYLMAAMLSATSEKFPEKAWHLNMQSLLNVLDLAKEKYLMKVFWPSSIAVFGPDTPKNNTPQETIINPSTVYGISKRAGELWCSYYHQVHGVDVRSLRYPGIISHKTAPGGGTTDYAVEIFSQANRTKQYNSFIKAPTTTPMIYMSDAIDATLTLMNAPAENISIRTSYNLGGLMISPEKLAKHIKKQLPDFEISYTPDYRQKIADSWPESIDDRIARNDWGYHVSVDLEQMVSIMLANCL